MNTKEERNSLLAVLVVLCCVFGYSWYSSYKIDKQKEERIEAIRQDSIRKAYIADSLKHDLRYQDSIRKAEEKYQQWKVINDSIEREEIVGFVFLPDAGYYHNNFHPMVEREDGFEHCYSELDIDELRFVTYGEVSINKLSLCPECDKIEDVYISYEEGDLIKKE